MLVHLKTRRADEEAQVFGEVASPLRDAGAGTLGKDSRPRAAAVGATRPARVVVAGVLAIIDLGELAQRFQQVRDLHRAGRVGRFLEYQQQPCPARQVSLRVVPQSVVADSVKTTR